MEFLTSDLRATLLTELRRAASVQIAVAFFCPEEDVLASLKTVPRLKLLVADNFQVNNPANLKALSEEGHWVRALNAEAHGGNLHSKVYLVRRRDDSYWALVGSANLTRPGLTSNQEACVSFDSRAAVDIRPLSEIRAWLRQLLEQGYPQIDFEIAKMVFEAQKERPHQKAKATSAQDISNRYWALKPGYCGEYWERFLAENVVAIGWEDIGDPSAMTHDEIARAYRKTWPDAKKGQVRTSVPQIIRFSQTMNDGDLVVICGRYTSIGHEDTEAYIYGVARVRTVNGECYFFDHESDWYGLKRHATIQVIKQSLPRSLVARALGVKSIVPTIQELDRKGFGRLEALLRRDLGIVLRI